MYGNSLAWVRHVPRPQKRQLPRAVFSQVQQFIARSPGVPTPARIAYRHSGPTSPHTPASDGGIVSDTQRPRYLLQNGELVEYDQARVHILSTAFKYAAVIFEGFRAYWNEDRQELF